MKIVADFILPFKIPVKDGIKQISKYSFGELQTEYTTVTEGVDIYFNNVISSRSCLRITYFPTNGMENESLDNMATDILRAFVLNCLYHINSVIDGMKIAYGVQYISRISVRDLQTMISIDVDGEVYGYMTNPDIILDEQRIESADDFAKVGATMTSMSMYPEVFLVEAFYESAKTALHYEQFTSFIVDIQTSFEIFIRNSLRIILKKLGKSDEEIEKGNKYPFRNVIEYHLSLHLGESLDFMTNQVINKWYEKVYSIRNDIVHRGFFSITGAEANEAITAYEEARNYIADLMVNKGFLTDKGMIDLKIFKKNQFDEKKSEELLQNMISRGLIDSNKKIIRRGDV